MDDGTEIKWGDKIMLPDGTIKEASIDDIDRTKLSNLLTVTWIGEVVHSLGFGKDVRDKKLAIWRSYWEKTDRTPIARRGALAGWHEKHRDGSTSLKLDFISNDGEVTSGVGYSIQLHPREVFTEEEAEAIKAAQEEQNEKSRMDNSFIEEMRNVPIELLDFEDLYLQFEKGTPTGLSEDQLKEYGAWYDEHFTTEDDGSELRVK